MNKIQEVQSRLTELFSSQEVAFSEALIYQKLSEISEIFAITQERWFPSLDQSEKNLQSHEVFSKEYYEALGKFIQFYREKNPRDNFSLLEIGAGSGEFWKHLKKQIWEMPLHMTDPNKNTPESVEKLSYLQAIHKYKPTLVIAVWPYVIKDYDWKSLFFQDLARCTEIEWCILVWVPERCHFGIEDFEGYTNYWFREWPFLQVANLFELSRKQIGIQKGKEWDSQRIKNGVNPFHLRDQGISSQTQWIENLYTTSRTYFLFRKEAGQLSSNKDSTE